MIVSPRTEIETQLSQSMSTSEWLCFTLQYLVTGEPYVTVEKSNIVQIVKYRLRLNNSKQEGSTFLECLYTENGCCARTKTMMSWRHLLYFVCCRIPLMAALRFISTNNIDLFPVIDFI